METNDLYEMELLDIELFDHLTVCKQMTDINWIVIYIAILGTI